MNNPHSIISEPLDYMNFLRRITGQSSYKLRLRKAIYPARRQWTTLYDAEHTANAK